MKPLEVRAYEIFKSKFGQQEAGIIIEFFDKKVDMKFEEKKDMLATKADINDLRLATKQDINALSLATRADINALKLATKEDINALRLATKEDTSTLKLDIAAVRKEVADSKGELIRWSFIFWAGNTIATIGGLLAILKLFFIK